MKLIEIKNLTEQVKAFTGDEHGEEEKYIIENIKRDCQPFIKAGMPQLWRGIDTNDSMIRKLSSSLFIGSVRNKRKPRDSSMQLQKIADEYFKSKVGIPIRSASLFVTGNSGNAEDYGDPYLILPIGEFHFVWSPMLEDFYAELDYNLYDYHQSKELQKIIDLEFKNLNIDKDEEAKNSDLIKFYKNLFANHGDKIYKFDGDLNKAVKSENEIMVVCDKYYIFKEANGVLYKDIVKAVK